MPTAIQAASGKAEEEPILSLYRRRIRGPRGNAERLGCCTPDADRRGRGAFSWGGGQRSRSSSGRRGRRRRSKRQALAQLLDESEDVPARCVTSFSYCSAAGRPGIGGAPGVPAVKVRGVPASPPVASSTAA